MKRALVTGAAGQDGYYLVDLLSRLGYAVHAQSLRPAGSAELRGSVHWHVGDLTEASYLEGLLASVSPDEIYNLAAISSPLQSWKMARQTAEVNALVPQRICEWLVRNGSSARLFQATSSEIFGNPAEEFQNESTAPAPQSPYGIAKLYAHDVIRAYREQYGVRACSGIMFNHESPRRPLSYVSQKIAYGAAAASLGIAETPARDLDGAPILQGGKIRLGNLEVRRDFGFAGDYAEAMHLILQHPDPNDYVIGTGQSHSIREFCETAFGGVGLDWQAHVTIDPALIRKVDSRHTRADATRLRTVLGWTPRTSFEELVDRMVSANIRALKGSGAALPM